VNALHVAGQSKRTMETAATTITTAPPFLKLKKNKGLLIILKKYQEPTG
jgi:hypothetical protein